ncbi:MAG: GAF domain-containing protein [Myxococcales bacterium]|nr:GAF domain-containing protein [Myxococcales bacterium]
MLVRAVGTTERDASDVQLSLSRERERTRALREVGLLIDSSLAPDELLERILAAAKRVAEAERGTLYLLQPDGRTLQSHTTQGGTPTTIVLPVDKGIAGACATARTTINIADAYDDPRFDRAWDTRTGFRTRAVLAVPMVAPDGRLVGVVQVLNRADHGAFDQDDVATLEALAAQATVALEAARTMATLVERNRSLEDLKARLERSLRERQLLLEIEQLLSRADSLDEFLDGTLVELLRECGANAGCIALTDPITGLSTLRAVRGVPDGASLIGRSVAEGAALVTVVSRGEAIQRGDDSSPVQSALPGPEARTLLVVPLPGEGGLPRGAIEVRDSIERGFTATDRALVELVAANVSTGIELSQARIERERATRLATLGKTLGNVVHDIRTPMSVISGYAQLMPDVESKEERRKYAQSIVRQFGLVQSMITELLAFVRGESSVLFQRVPIESFFTEIVEVLRRDLAARNVRVELELRERGAARIDPAKITRLVHNLARNAADALAQKPNGGTFTIRVSRAGEQLVLEFEDDGPGIPEAVRLRLFESFVTQGKPDGTGLGLAIVKKVVDDHNGTVDVTTSPEGTRFTVKLPLQSTATLPRATNQP